AWPRRGLSDGLCENFHHRKTSTSIRVATRRVLESPFYTLVYDEPHLPAEECMNSGRISTFFCRENRPRRDSHAFEDGRDALAAADAHGLEAVAGLAAVHLAQHGGQDPAAGGADGMAERDARTVDIESIEVALAQAPFASDGERLRGEGFIEFDEVDVGQLEAGLLQRPGGGRDRADAHGLRGHTGDGPADQA